MEIPNSGDLFYLRVETSSLMLTHFRLEMQLYVDYASLFLIEGEVSLRIIGRTFDFYFFFFFLT